MSSETNNNSDKRNSDSLRYVTKETAQIEVYGRMGTILCKMSNLSKSGAFLEIVNSTFLPKSGDLVRITILLKQIKKTHVIDAEVVWSRGLGLGLSFLKKPDLVEKLSSRLSAT